MIVTVASGKGGTGKTLVSASLASVWSEPVTVVDLDVEEPNLHLFLNPEIAGSEPANMVVPVVDEDKCNHCKACAELCQFGAIIALPTGVLIFPNMCHGCEGCIAVCPEKALTPGKRELGTVSWGTAGRNDFVMGTLRVGEAMSPPLMRAVKTRAVKTRAGSLQGGKNHDIIIDAPPGVSCPAITATMGSDVILLVTEPTPFGVYDLELAERSFRALNRPMAVIINRAGLGDRDVYEYCESAGLPILAEIPYDRRVAEAYSQGLLAVDVSEEYQALFTDLAVQIKTLSTSSQEAVND